MIEGILYITPSYVWLEGMDDDDYWYTDPFVGLFAKRKARRWAQRNNITINEEVDAWTLDPIYIQDDSIKPGEPKRLIPSLPPDYYPNHRRIPVFSGKTEASEKVVLYYVRGDVYHLLLRPDGELWQLSPASKVELRWEVHTSMYYLEVASPEWSGRAIGTRLELIEEPSLP